MVFQVDEKGLRSLPHLHTFVSVLGHSHSLRKRNSYVIHELAVYSKV